MTDRELEIRTEQFDKLRNFLWVRDPEEIDYDNVGDDEEAMRTHGQHVRFPGMFWYKMGRWSATEKEYYRPMTFGEFVYVQERAEFPLRRSAV